MYGQVYSLTLERLKEYPMDGYYLSLHGLSAYQLSTSQINIHDQLGYMDACIWSIRKAMMLRGEEKDLRLSYVLGKAYYHKGPLYADLAVRYLAMAFDGGYKASDIAEYQGLAYASLKDYRSSVSAFSRALEPMGDSTGLKGTSDLLLLAIARSYLGLGEQDSAKSYLIRSIESSKDASVVIQSRMLLGTMFVQKGDLQSAEKEFLAVADMDDKNADAHYQLGELYLVAGDPVKARAEWRKSIRIDPTHGPTRTRLSL